MKHSRLLLLFCLMAYNTTAQNFGGNPPQRWAQVNTDTVRVIFPVGLDSVANRIATIAHYLQRDTSASFRFRKINLVLQNNATASNAYVSLAPYMSEFYLMAPQNPFELGSLSWADNLVIHEWRHVQQFNYFNRGLSRVAGLFLGQEGRALFNAISVPDWYFEGDAVWNETKFSRQGRGRLPLAFSGYKSLFLEGKRYSYMKLRNGSLKDYVPNHYDLGYLLVAYGAEKYGADFWTKVTADASAFRPIVYPLQGAVKRYAGIPFKQFVDEAFNFYEKQWKQEVDQSEIRWITKPLKYRSDYLFPYTNENGSVIAVKQSSKHNPSFYKVSDDGTEEKIAAQGLTLDRYFSYRNGRIVYASYATDARWTNRQYSNITIVDVNTKSERKLTQLGKFFSPDITADGRKIVAVEMSPSAGSALVVLNDIGERITTIPAGTGEVYSQPKFSANGESVFVPVRNSRGLMGLQKIIPGEEGKPKMLVPFSNHVIGYPVVNGDTVVFTATSKNKDVVYAWIESSEKLYQIASYPTGLYQSTFTNGKLVTSAFTATGHRLGTVQTTWKEVAAPGGVENIYVEKALSSPMTVERIATQRYSYRKYSTLSHPFNFHSWRPFYDQPEFSFTVYGQNVLNTISTQLSYIYNQNENTHAAAGSLIYGGTFLQPFISVRNTWNRSFAFRPDTVARWNEFEYAGGFRLPLNLSGGKMYRFLNLSASYHSSNINFTGANKNLFTANDVRYFTGRLTFSSQLQQASQHIYPKFAISTLLQLRTALNTNATQFLASGSVYLPGLMRTHSTVLSIAYQGRDTMRRYAFTNGFPLSRGYNVNIDFPRMWKFGANYHFPLMHPDWGLANIVFFQRVRANAFTDYSEVQSLRTKQVFRFQSFGGEVYFDTRWWNQLPVSFGVRYSRLVDGNLVGLAPNQWEFIVPVDLIR